VQPGAGVADDGRLRARWLARRFRQPMLHTHPGLGTFEYDVTIHAGPVVPAPVGHQNYGCLLRSLFAEVGFSTSHPPAASRSSAASHHLFGPVRPATGGNGQDFADE